MFFTVIYESFYNIIVTALTEIVAPLYCCNNSVAT
jgi:hypothetical protein